MIIVKSAEGKKIILWRCGARGTDKRGSRVILIREGFIEEAVCELRSKVSRNYFYNNGKGGEGRTESSI